MVSFGGVLDGGCSANADDGKVLEARGKSDNRGEDGAEDERLMAGSSGDNYDWTTWTIRDLASWGNLGSWRPLGCVTVVGGAALDLTLLVLLSTSVGQILNRR